MNIVDALRTAWDRGFEEGHDYIERDESVRNGDCDYILRKSLNVLSIELPVIKEWQPIDTAPKDGSLVLLYKPGEPVFVSSWADGSWRLSVNDVPELWAPIPELPT